MPPCGSRAAFAFRSGRPPLLNEIGNTTVIFRLCYSGSSGEAETPSQLTRSRLPSPPTILVFDSGLGGLTVFREIAMAHPGARFIYAADDAFFPYGRHGEAELKARVLAVMDGLISVHRPDLVVVACNTASTIVLADLRDRFKVPFVGTVPAIKPACAASKSKLVSVLGTEATVSREYTRALIRDFAQDCEITLVGSARLAGMAEAALDCVEVDDAAIATEIAPCFVDDGKRRTDTIVLACTHYPLLLDRFARNAPWAVDWIDPAPAIARRVSKLLPPQTADEPQPLNARAVFTSGRPLSGALTVALARFGFAPRQPASAI
jgi:glutamate racemase